MKEKVEYMLGKGSEGKENDFSIKGKYVKNRTGRQRLQKLHIPEPCGSSSSKPLEYEEIAKYK